MKLLSFEVKGLQRCGVWADGALVDLTQHLGSNFPCRIGKKRDRQRQQSRRSTFSCEPIPMPAAGPPAESGSGAIFFTVHDTQFQQKVTQPVLDMVGEWINAGAVAESEKLQGIGRLAVAQVEVACTQISKGGALHDSYVPNDKPALYSN